MLELDKFLSDAAHEVLENLPDLLEDEPVTVTAKCRARCVQVVVIVSTYKPARLNAATLARIDDLKEWPNEVVSLAMAPATLPFITESAT